MIYKPWWFLLTTPLPLSNFLPSPNSCVFFQERGCVCQRHSSFTIHQWKWCRIRDWEGLSWRIRVSAKMIQRAGGYNSFFFFFLECLISCVSNLVEWSSNFLIISIPSVFCPLFWKIPLTFSSKYPIAFLILLSYF